MSVAYSARQVPAETAEYKVLELWRQTRHNQVELENTFRWYYRSGSDRDNRCFVVEQTDQANSPLAAGQLVGATGLGVRKFRFGRDCVNAGLLGDFFVHKAHRSLFPALSLQRAATESARLTTAFVYGFPNAKALPVFRRLGFSELGTMSRYVRVLDYASYLERRLGQPRVARGVARLLNGFTQLRRPRSLLPSFRYRAAWESDFDERFDVLDRTSRLNVSVRGERSASLLNWRFVSKPGSSARIFTLCARGSDALRAYAIVEVEADVAHLRDVFGNDWQAIVELLRRLERELRRERVRSINFNLLDTSPLCALLGRLGYVLRESTRKVVLSAAARNVSNLSAPGAWHLTDADEDQ